jgi:amino acid adenylation domain-containing protein
MHDDRRPQVRYTGPVLQAVDFDPFAPLTPSQGEQSFALTAAQQEVFAAVQMNADATAAFNLCNWIELQGDLDMDALRRALARVVGRHAALRASIDPDGSMQTLHPEVPVELPHHVLAAADEHDAATALAQIAAQEAMAPLEMGLAPLWRARVVSWGDRHHALIFNAHHVICDGWSFSVLFADWAKAYIAERVEGTPTWTPHRTYDDFLRDQLSLETVARQKADRGYWQALHTPLPAPLALPLDRARPTLKTYACAQESCRIGPDDTRALRTLAARQGCTLFVALLASFQALCARLSGQNDIVLGVPLALQTQMANAHLVADGANVVPLRQTVSLEAPFGELLKLTRRALLDAHEHASLGFGSWVRALNLPHDPSRTPLVDVIFNLDRSQALPDFGDARFVTLDSAKVMSNSALIVDVVDDGQQLTVHWRYLTALLDSATVRRWSALWLQALQSWMADPQLTPRQALVQTAEERALIERFNATARPFAGPGRLEALVAEQAQRSPEAQAIWCSGRTWSYAQLDEMANGVAHALVADGVKCGEKVGILTGRHEAMVGGVLGILKAGASYVPLDQAFPPDRIAFAIGDAGLQRVLCDETTLAMATWPHVRAIDVRRCPPRTASPVVDSRDEDPAYVIYTSGTTGKPKGVVVNHHTACNFVRGFQTHPGMRRGERHAAAATLSFDIAVLDLFVTLSVGATLVILTRGDLEDAQGLSDRLVESRATSLQAAPSVWRHLLSSGWTGHTSFRAFSGGEALPLDLAQALKIRCAELWNLYGPTETTVYSTVARIEDPRQGIRVGLPMANTQIHILDHHLQPVPFGTTGEICIAGDGVAQGYLNRPEMTAERFVSDPQRPGHRMYRTGDVGRWHTDGLECLGRNDRQIKLRGWRIEPGEVENSLLSQPGVRQAVVHLARVTEGREALVAHVVCAAEDFDAVALRDAMRRQLPTVIVPTVFVRLDAIPVLANGKTDWQALASTLTVDKSIDQPERTLPVWSDDEQRVAAIWSSLLEIDDIRPTDNFFDLGGHSLLAAQAARRMSETLGFKIDVPRLVMESLSQVARRPAMASPAHEPVPSVSQQLAAWIRRWTQPTPKA